MDRSAKKDDGVDSVLIGRCVDGDQTAWAELVHRYERLVYSVASTLCHSREDAADVFQQVWLELYQQLADLRNAKALPAWLITVTRRRSYALLQISVRPEPLVEEDPAEIDKRIRQIEDEHAIERAVAQLPDRCRRLIELLYLSVDEPSYNDISAELGMPVSSIGPNRARCLEKLRKLLK